MTEIHFILPKRRMHLSNLNKWRYNHHKKPRYLISELNWCIRRSDDEDAEIYKILWRNKFNNRYQMKC